MALVALAGGVIVEGHGFDFRLPPEIRGMTEVRTDSSKWRVHQCLLDLSHEMSFADSCVDRNRRPLILIWGDSTAGALLPGLRKAQETHDFGIAQFTSSSCVPALNTDVAGVPNCRAINDKVLALARELKPDIVLLHSTWGGYLDGVAETVKALKQQTNARIIVLGSVPWWKRGLPNEVLRYFMLHHRSDSGAIRSRRGRFIGRALARETGAARRRVHFGAGTRCATADGCLARIGDTAKDISASDQVHLTEKGVGLSDPIHHRPGASRTKPALVTNGGDVHFLPRQSGLAARDDLAGIDAENLARRADADERRRIGAGHPDLRAKF